LIHLHVIPEAPAEGPVWGCGEIRLVRPLFHPSLAKRIKVTVARNMGLPPGRVDAIVTQRGGTVEATLGCTLQLLREVRRRRVPFIYDIDDDLLSRHPVPSIDADLAVRRPQIRLMLREADAVVASTPALAERLGHINPRISVWPNALDEALILRGQPCREVLRERDLLYMGTTTHLPDLMSVFSSIQEQLWRMGGQPAFDIVGVSDDPRIGLLLNRVCRTRALSAVADYPEFLVTMQRRAAWKVGIAPLAPHLFNRCKSDIKFLDYAVIGAAGVYSDSPVYSAVRSNDTGIIAPAAGFGSAVRDLLESPDRAARIRVQARDYVLAERVLSRRARDLGDLIEQSLDRVRSIGLSASSSPHLSATDGASST
jgi:hypothetical protein